MTVIQGEASSSRRRYWLFAGAVLALAAFNLTFRLGKEIVVEWDESLYGISAWEMLQSRQWIGTTFKGVLDYYNTKPPLNIWLILLSFKVFGTNLIALRLPSILSAWLTVVVLQEWTRRAIGPRVAILASLVLATSFGFLYDHAGRNANTDALFALLVLLTAVTLWAANDRPWRLVWLGPVAAAAFLLRGMGVLMPVAIVFIVEVARREHWRRRWLPMAVAALVFAAPVAAWVWVRWQLDQWRFLGPLVTNDFLALTFTALEGHEGTPFYHLNVLQKNQYDWLLAGIVACFLFPFPWSRLRTLSSFWRSRNAVYLVIAAWVGVTLLFPTLIRTKVSWYLNPFYPAFALGLAWLFVRGFANADAPGQLKRRRMLAATIVLALVVAETRLVLYSVHRRSLAGSTQGFLLAERRNLQGHRVFRSHWTNSDAFVIGALVGAEAVEAPTPEDFVRVSAPGDYWMSRHEIAGSSLILARSHAGHWLYQRIGQ